MRTIYRYFALLLPAVLAVAVAMAKAPEYRQVETRENAQKPNWQRYETKTVDRLPGFNCHKADPKQDIYGGWMVDRQEATGFFRTQKIGDRWWMITPEGYPYICKGIAVFSMGGSDRQKKALGEKFGTPAVWAEKEQRMLRSYGFNSLGAWSAVDVVRTSPQPMPYTVIVSPMGAYHREHRKHFGGKYKQAGWQGYRFDLAMVFDPGFDALIDRTLSGIARYKDDKYLVGYFTDNELPWVNDALDRHLTLLAHDEEAYIAVRKWFDERKGKDAAVERITEEDRKAFRAFYFETYIKKVSAALRKYDPNHLYLGCRFNQHKEEMVSPEIFEVAGRYMDVISINHYRLWEPRADWMENWEKWSGKPFMITEFYTKGEDSDLPNNTGAGWNVPTQADRGWFYQNFVTGLLRSGNCVGWHWFTYMDNDPQNLKTDPSNRDSNKGVVNWAFEPYTVLLDEMKQLNDCTYRLIGYLDAQKAKEKSKTTK
ncbi:hypothetical protein [uncultured Alistipes sp.]|jgi:beta-agarase-like protein; glycoside hydrolase family 50|uniref:hypothetical protein n=1 Tax=uncultured Alistipes sp. TaxID=538949 RepID=UPI0025FFE896|nr:hypothetical protein [uncultured Alistipes sp.]